MLEVTAAIIRRDNRVLLCQRPAGKRDGLLWEFPGGKIEMGESARHCVIRECLEELSVALRLIGKLAVIEQSDLRLHFFVAEIESGELTCCEHNAWAWVTLNEARAYPLCLPDARMLADPRAEGIFSMRMDLTQ